MGSETGFKVEKRDGRRGRAVLTGMVVSTPVLARVEAQWDEKDGLFGSRWENVVARWCVRHYRKFGKAPGRQIVHLYEAWAERADKDTAALVSDYLSALSADYAEEKKKTNPDVVIDLAGEHFNRVRATRTADRAKDLVGEGKVKEALDLMEGVRPLQVADADGIDVFEDDAVWDSTFSRSRDPIVTYPGAAGRFLGPALERDGFVAFMAPEKRGKTYALLDLAFRSVQSRRRTAFFAVGDMSRDQMMDRIAERVARHPLTSPTGEWPYVVKVPVGLESVEGEDGRPEVRVVTEDRSFDGPLSLAKAKKAKGKFKDRFVRSKDPYLKLFVHPNNSITAAGVEGVIAGLGRRGWPVDVAVIDYADLLAPPPGYLESRDATNATWKTLRSCSQKHHMLMVTATQAKATSYKSDSLDMSDFSEDKRKLAHVTGMIGINQVDHEKKQGLYRWNWVVRRNAPYHSKSYVYMAACLPFADPCVVSSF